MTQKVSDVFWKNIVFHVIESFILLTFGLTYDTRNLRYRYSIANGFVRFLTILYDFFITSYGYKQSFFTD